MIIDFVWVNKNHYCFFVLGLCEMQSLIVIIQLEFSLHSCAIYHLMTIIISWYHQSEKGLDCHSSVGVCPHSCTPPPHWSTHWSTCSPVVVVVFYWWQWKSKQRNNDDIDRIMEHVIRSSSVSQAWCLVVESTRVKTCVVPVTKPFDIVIGIVIVPVTKPVDIAIVPVAKPLQWFLLFLIDTITTTITITITS